MNKDYKINLPEPLTEEEQIHFLKEKTKEAREKLINNNIRLVIYEVYRRFDNTIYEIEDLISIGIIGLIKGIDSYDITKNYKLSTYLTRCIDNEILMHLRKNKRVNEISINETLSVNNEGQRLTIMDTLTEECIIEEIVEERELIKKIKEIIYNLNEVEKQVLILSFGLEGNEKLSHRQIEKKLDISRINVYRIIKKVLEKIRQEIIETPNHKEKTKNNLQ